MNHRPLDRVNEAYKGELGEIFKTKTIRRVNWIVNQVRGMKILDIGCSQGIISIILGREGKIVDAIDIAPESIEYAQADLKQEHSSVQKNVRFRVANFMNDTELYEEYETILLTEVLEHISDTDSFLNRVKQYLAPNGGFIVTVPFGINDYFDHKRTYYFTSLYEQLSSKFFIEKIEYIGNWIGVVCKNSDETQQLDLWAEVKKLEAAFYEVESEYLTKVRNLQKLSAEKDSKIKLLQMELKQLSVDPEFKGQLNSIQQKIDWNGNLADRLNDQINQLTDLTQNFINSFQQKIDRNGNLADRLNHQVNQLTDLTKNLTEQLKEEREKNKDRFDEFNKILLLKSQLEVENEKLKNELQAYKNQLHTSLTSEEKALKGSLKDKDQIDQLSKQLSYYEQRYVKLKNSLLGRITVKYWSFRKKLRIYGIKGVIKKLFRR